MGDRSAAQLDRGAPDEPARGGGRVARAALAAAVLGIPLLAIAFQALTSPRIAFVVPGRDRPWMMAPRPVSAQLEQWGRRDAPVTSFARRIERPGGGGLVLRLRALGAFELWINGERAAAGDGERWRTPLVLDATPWLRDGANELRIDVARATGPALVEIGAEGAPGLGAASEWRVRLDGEALGPALPADDTRPDPDSLAVETPMQAAARVWPAWAGLFAAGALAGWASGRSRRAWIAHAGVAGLALAVAGWLLFFAARAARIPAAVGFDARHHLYYAAWIREHLALPLASDGWSTYHPPLLYALSAPLLPAGEPVGAALKLLPWLGGLGVVVTSYLLARRLLPGDGVAQLLAVGFAAVLPVNLYSAAYFSNEPLHAGLAGLVLWLGAGALLCERVGWGRALALGAALGLAALAKFTALLLVPALGVALLWRVGARHRSGVGRALGEVALVFAAAGVLAGWFYLRNWIHFGDPVIGNWSLPGAEQRWWQQPGFHTPAYYAGFGEALSHPYLAGFHSFWDALYSTFWGDGYVAGRTDPARRHDFWNYAFMSAGYLAALPATLALALGAACGVRRALADADPAQRLVHAWLLLSAWSVGLAFAYLTLRLPFFAQAKAAYLLPIAPALAVWFALGAQRLDAALAGRLGAAGRALGCGLWALCAGTFFLAFVG